MSRPPQRSHRGGRARGAPRPAARKTGGKDGLAGERRLARERVARLERSNAALRADLERAAEELKVFAYSVSHDLRAPLRAIDGFSRMVLEESADGLDGPGRDRLLKVRVASRRMGELIDALLELSRIAGAEIRRGRVGLSELARGVCGELGRLEPGRSVALSIEDGLAAEADAPLARKALEHLLGNAWKFTSKVPEARIAFGAERRDGGETFFVRDNGAGFDMRYAERLFRPFQRLHTEAEFPGTGMGLAAVRRIVERHGGRVWAEGAAGNGASFFFTLPPAEPGSD